MPDRDWMVGASCRNSDPELFFPLPGQRPKRQAAQRICRDCPVSTQCRKYADEIGAAHGVWAGKYRNRNWSHARRGEFRPCGTYAAYTRHLRHGESPCERCRVANNAYQNAKAKRRTVNT